MTDAPNRLKLYFLIGPTACGKSGVALELAPMIGAEILCMDSMSVYREMSIISAKPTAEDRASVRHHLLDLVDPDESFSVGRYVEDVDRTAREVTARGNLPLLVGGTALYLKTLTEGLFEGPPADATLREKLKARASTDGSEALHKELQLKDHRAAEKIHPNDLRRIVRALEVVTLTGKPISEWQQQFGSTNEAYDCLIIGLRRDRQELYARVERRVDQMFQSGLLDEVRALSERQPPIGKEASQALGYPELTRYLRGESSLEEAKSLIKTHTRQFAKRQLTWFRSFRNIRWVDVSSLDAPHAVAQRIADEYFPGILRS